MDYIASIGEKTNWKKDPKEIVADLSKNWPSADIRFIGDASKNFSYEWGVQISGQSLDGMLHKDGTALTLDGEIQDCALFAIWFRTEVPKEIKMLFYNQSYTIKIPLEEKTTVSDIVEAFKSS